MDLHPSTDISLAEALSNIQHQVSQLLQTSVSRTSALSSIQDRVSQLLHCSVSETSALSNIQDQVSQLLTSVSKTSAEKVAENEYLLNEILLRLPVRSLVRFKCVSKPWLHLISSPHFSHTHSTRNFRSLSVSGFFFPNSTSSYGFLWVDGARPEFAPSSVFMEKPVRIIQSCNGLMLCAFSPINEIQPLQDYFVCNPTIKKFSYVPPPPLAGLDSKVVSFLNLAFDPSRSPHFSVVCVSGVIGRLCTDLLTHRTLVYSSKSQSWSCIENAEGALLASTLNNGVFWNGSIYWLCADPQNLIRFEVDKHCFNIITMKTDRHLRDSYFSENSLYLGQCKGKLYLVAGDFHSSTGVVVYEMGKDRSKWLVKYKTDLIHAIADIYESYSSDEEYCCTILGVVGGQEEDDDDDDDDDDLQLLVQLENDEVILYGIKEKTTTTMPFVDFFDKAHPYIESLSPVI